MAFSSTVIAGPIPNDGGKRIVRGTFTNTGGSTGGDVETSLAVVEGFKLQYTGAAIVANSPVVNETLPLNGGAVTIVTDADANGLWEAVGY